MIWYLLYPFRGTTEGPVLEESHPLRIALARYGRYAASHVVTTLLVSVAVATVLIYPFPFLYTTDFTSGASILPEHAWTDTLPLVDKNRVEPDVIMRSIWVHGDYFQALNRNVLLSALDLQDELLGPTVNFNPRRYIAGDIDNINATNTDLTLDQRDALHVANGLTNQSWFFQSPLQYWSCSSETIEQDDDIIATANERKTQSTSVNVTLRHSTVFSGKRFQDRQLVAADALVITLVHLRDSPVGRQWQEKVQALKQNPDDNWDIFDYSPNGKTSEMYEFQFRPMSSQDVFLLGLAYALVLIYFLTSLSKLRAVKSKVGLMVTVIAQIVLAIFSSFTICAIFKIDLSRIPRLGYPVVIFSMSLENIFRLINAVILTPSEHNTSKRIGYAFGETGYVALTSVTQNLVILYGLSKLVSPGVSAFCTFTAIALIFDFFYLSTFFLSVLSVDVRRTELSDALAKASIRSHRSASDPQSRQTWLDAMLQGRIAMSTRIAGTIVMVGFVVISQWHFFENESVIRALSRILYISPKYKNLSLPSSLSEVHQGRSPASWLGLQDHETARELIHVIKPDAHSYIARVFYPTIFVLRGSDRNLSANEPWFPPAVYDFIRHQSSLFIITVIVIAAAVRLLMNYLLWDELADSARVDGADHDPLLSVKTLSRGHTLDVALLTASSDGHLVSVGLDRVIRVWDVKAGGESYMLGDNGDSFNIPFPILAVCIDDESHWLALLTSGKVLLWNLVDFRWGPVLELEPDRHKPEAFFFVPDDSVTIPSLVVIRRDGALTELRTDQVPSKSAMLTKGSSIVSVSSLAEKGYPAQVIASTREGQVRIATQEGTKWSSSIVNEGSSTERELVSIQSLSELDFFLVIRFQIVDLVDSQTLRTIYTFNTDPIQPKSVKCFHSRPRRMRCGSVALWSFTIAYNHAYTRDLMVHTYSPQNEGESLCFCDPASPTRKTCCPWQRAKVSKRTIKNPGVWDALPCGIIVGVRKKTSEKSRADGHDDTQRLQHLGNLRRRHQPSQPVNGHIAPDNNWEVWMFSHFGKKETWETLPLCSKVEDDGHLFVNSLGPMARIGRASLAIGLSNVIKVIMVGNERFETGDRAQPEDGMPALGNRRRKGPSTLRAKHAHCPHC